MIKEVVYLLPSTSGIGNLSPTGGLVFGKALFVVSQRWSFPTALP